MSNVEVQVSNVVFQFKFLNKNGRWTTANGCLSNSFFSNINRFFKPSITLVYRKIMGIFKFYEFYFIDN